MHGVKLPQILGRILPQFIVSWGAREARWWENSPLDCSQSSIFPYDRRDRVQLKLNPLSTQINIYCLMTNQTPALLVQLAPWTRAAVLLLQSLYFSAPRPPAPVRAIIPDARPLSTFENQGNRDGKTDGMSKRSHEKIETVNSLTCLPPMWPRFKSWRRRHI